MEQDTGLYQCGTCGWVYDPEKGDGNFVQPGKQFTDLASNWRCPSCRSSGDVFKSKTLTIAGFQENQGYGFGTNAMTEGQKSGIIFGGLGFFFLLLMAGYLLD